MAEAEERELGRGQERMSESVQRELGRDQERMSESEQRELGRDQERMSESEQREPGRGQEQGGMPAWELAGAVLAGGQNRRMGGRLKALLPLGEQLFIERQLEALGQVCGDIVIVTNTPEMFEPVLEMHARQHRLEGGPAQPAGVQIIRDLHPGLGPLAGMQAAMAASRCEALWVVACDMPFASAAAAAAMAARLRADDRCDAVVPRIGQRLHPLHAVYRRRCLPAVSRLLDAGTYRVMKLLEELEVAEAEESFFAERGIAADFCINVNAPEDWRRL